ncbi:MAG TPA: hypothetical protein VJC12_02775 [Candidatus Paceibacterota bacterium]
MSPENSSEGMSGHAALVEALKAGKVVENVKRFEEASAIRPDDADATVSVVEADIDGHHVVLREHPPLDFNTDPITWSGEVGGVTIEEEDVVELLDTIKRVENK